MKVYLVLCVFLLRGRASAEVFGQAALSLSYSLWLSEFLTKFAQGIRRLAKPSFGGAPASKPNDLKMHHGAINPERDRYRLGPSEFSTKILGSHRWIL